MKRPNSAQSWRYFPPSESCPSTPRVMEYESMELCRPRQFGACWLACHLYEQLGLDQFWTDRLPDSREGTCWRHILQTLVC